MYDEIFGRNKKRKCKVAIDKAVMTEALAGAFIFLVMYGVKILDPCYTDWLLQRGDMTQHYLGWMAYRNSKWHFPIGMTSISGIIQCHFYRFDSVVCDTV